MTRHAINTVLLAVLALAVSNPVEAQRRFTNEEIVSAIIRCMAENAPEDWQTFIFRQDQGPGGAAAKKPAAVEHKVIATSTGSAPQDLKPCRPDYVPKAINTFRENQDDKGKRWTGIVLTIQRDGSFSLTFNYPK